VRGVSWSINSAKRRAYGNARRQHYPSKTQNYCWLNNSAIVPRLRGVHEYSGGATIPKHPQLGRGKADRDRSVLGRCRCRSRAADGVEIPQRLARQQTILPAILEAETVVSVVGLHWDPDSCAMIFGWWAAWVRQWGAYASHRNHGRKCHGVARIVTPVERSLTYTAFENLQKTIHDRLSEITGAVHQAYLKRSHRYSNLERRSLPLLGPGVWNGTWRQGQLPSVQTAQGPPGLSWAVNPQGTMPSCVPSNHRTRITRLRTTRLFSCEQSSWNPAEGCPAMVKQVRCLGTLRPIHSWEPGLFGVLTQMWAVNSLSSWASNLRFISSSDSPTSVPEGLNRQSHSEQPKPWKFRSSIHIRLRATATV